MKIVQLIGGNEVDGIKIEKVIVNGEALGMSYKELAQLCGDIPVDTVYGESYREDRELLIDFIEELGEEDAEALVDDNKLNYYVGYSTYAQNGNGNYDLEIDAYD